MNYTQDNAIARLRNDYGVRAGSTIYTKVLHVSRSGMTRTIGCYVVRKGEVFDVSHLVAPAIGATLDRDRGGVKVQGCGMDMTFYVVYSLARAMFPKGVKCNGISEGRHRCPSNDHSNDWGIAHRMADDELEAEGLSTGDTYEERRESLAVRNERAAVIAEREGLNYRKGRKHADGGYHLTRASL